MLNVKVSKIKELLKSPHIQIALATGFSIIILAFFSKRILKEPIGFIPLAIPAFIASVFETLLGKYGESKLLTTWYWITAVLLSAVITIFIYI
jgi:hypothetical protein